MFNLLKKKEGPKERYITTEEWECIKQMDKFFATQYIDLMKDIFRKATGSKKVDMQLFENVMNKNFRNSEVRNGLATYLFFEIIKKLDRLEDLIKSDNKSSNGNKKSGNRNKFVKKK